MLYRFKRGMAYLALATAAIFSSSATTQAGWGHHHLGHHHRGLGYGGFGYSGIGYGGFGYSSFYSGFGSYTSINIGLPRYRAFAPGFSYYSGYSPILAPRYYSYSVAVPRVYVAPSYYVAPTYYAAPSYYVAPSYYAAPTYVAPLCSTSSFYSTSLSAPSYYAPSVSTPDCCGATTGQSVATPYSTSYPSYDSGYPTVQPPAASNSGYSTGIAPQSISSSPVIANALPSYRDTMASATRGGSFVDRMLGHVSTSSVTGSTPLVASTTASPPATSRTAARPVITTSIDSSLRASSVSAASYATTLQPLPEELLMAADDMFAAGGYAEAAAAYARLTVRYGNHDQLVARRFVALVASGDCDQAAVVHQLASATGRSLQAGALPKSSLAQLYGLHLGNRRTHGETLAGYALNRPEDATALDMVGTWLELDGQPERAQIFHQRAAMLSPAEERFAAAPSSPTRLVGTDVAR